MSRAFRIQSGPVQIAAVAIIAALSWRFGIRPLEARAMELRAEADAAERSLLAARSSGDDVAPDPDLMNRVTRADQQIRTLASAGQRQNRLHEEVAKVAQECGVRLASLEPRGKGATVAANAPMKISSSVWTAEASGSYAALVQFMDVIEARIPLSRIQAFRLVGGGPVPGAPEAMLSVDFASVTVTRPQHESAGPAAKGKKTSAPEAAR